MGCHLGLYFIVGRPLRAAEENKNGKYLCPSKNNEEKTDILITK
jgi:hypothetical protein